MAKNDLINEALPRKPDERRLSPRSELHFTQAPIIEDRLSGDSLPVFDAGSSHFTGQPEEKDRNRKSRARATLEEFLEPLDGVSLPGIERLKKHVRDKYRRGCKPNTIRSKIQGVPRFLRFLQEQGKQEIEDVSREDLEGFVEHEQDRGMAPTTVRNRLGISRTFLVCLADEGVVDPLVLLRPLRVKVPDTLPRAMAPDDVKALIDAIVDVRARAMVFIMLRTGMRIGEVLDARMLDVHLKERRIEIPQASKNGTGRVVYLADDACVAIRAWFRVRDETRAFVFHSPCRDRLGY